MKRRLLVALLPAVVILSPLLLAAAQTGSGVVTLTVNVFTEINVADSTITVTWPVTTTVTTSTLAWFAFNLNDFFQVDDGYSNTNVTVVVTDYSIDALPRAYPTNTLGQPQLYFALDQAATSMPATLYFNATIPASMYSPSANAVISIPASVDVDNDGVAETCTNDPILVALYAQANVTKTAIYFSYDATNQQAVIERPLSTYINIAVTTCGTYTVLFAKVTDNQDDFNYTDASGALYNADFVLDPADPLTPEPNSHVLTLTFNLVIQGQQVTLTKDFIVLQRDANSVILAPAELLSYDANPTTVNIFGLIELPRGAPVGDYKFTVNLAVEAVST